MDINKRNITMEELEISKLFKSDHSELNIMIKGTDEEPLFRASDIGNILGITNIHQNLTDFDSSQKVICLTYTLGGEQETTFLTEFGLYELIFRSRKPIAKQFKKWVCEVIKEIRIKGKYELHNQLKNKEEELKIKDKEINQTIIINFKNKHVVYLIMIGNGIIKFGYTRDIEQRIKDHKTEFGKDIIIKTVFETVYNREFELMIKEDPILKKYIIQKTFKTNQTELIQLSDEFTYDHLNKRMEQLKETINGDLVPNLLKRINDLEQEKQMKESKEQKTTLEKEKTMLLKQVTNEPFKAINISTQEIISFKSFSDSNKISGIGPHSIKDNYLDKPRQHNGFVYFSVDKPYWKPPTNFKFDNSVKPSIHMIMCKSIHKETGEITYYNSIKEAGKILGLENDDTTFRKFSWLCAENASGKCSGHEILNKYFFYKVSECGSWIYPDLSEIAIEEKLIVKKINEKGISEELIINLQQLESIEKNNQTIKLKKAIKKTTESFIEESMIIHGTKFDYSKVDYKGSRINVTIICKIHGEFEQTPTRHLTTRGCMKC
jgi:prophage antirepressor-like protein